MKLVILLLVLPCFVRSSKEQCSNGTQSCLINGLQTCCDIQFSEDAGSIKPFYAAAKHCQYLNDSSTHASMQLQHGFDIRCSSLWCSGTCCTSTECCPYMNGACCSASRCCPSGNNCCKEGCCESGHNCCGDGCCESGYNCCGDGCCPSSSMCCPKHGHCCKPGYSCCNNGCCSTKSECCGEYCCPSGTKCCGGKWCCENTKTCGQTLGSCFGAAGTLNPTVSALIVMLVLSLKMRFN